MTTVRERFPHWYAASQVDGAEWWNSPCEFDDVVYASSALRRLLAEEHSRLPSSASPSDTERYDAMREVFVAIRVDVARISSLEEPGWHDLACSVLLIDASMRLARIALDRGDLRATHQALLGALTDVEQYEGEYVDVRPGRVLVLGHPEQPLPDSVVSEPLLRWSELVFVYDRFRSFLLPVAQPLFGVLAPWVIARLGTDDEYFWLALAMAQWARHRDVDDSTLVAALDTLSVEGAIPPDGEAAYAILEVQRLASRSDGAAPRRAIELLESLRGRLTGTEMFQLVGYATQGTEVAEADHSGVVDRIDALMRDWRTTTPDAFFMADRRGAHFPLIGRVIGSLLALGRPDLVGPALGAWVEVPAAQRRDDLLLWLTSYEPGLGWAFDRCISLSYDPEVVARYVRAAGGFLNLRTWVRGDDTPDTVARDLDGAPGIPNDRYEESLSMCAVDALALASLREVLECAAPNEPGALVAMQDVGWSVQPMMIREFGRTFPWSVSLRRPLPDRALSRAAVVLTGTDLGKLETTAVSEVLRAAGAVVMSLESSSLSRDMFLEIYANADFDLLWVVGHGLYDHLNPAASHLPMPDGSRVSVGDLEEHRPMTERRRLLVLNLCDAATALIAGGPPEFGLGVRAASSTQAVVGHRWPVMSWPDAVLIGRLLAGELARTDGFFEAYSATIRLICQGAPAVRDRLSGQGGDLDRSLREDLGDRLEERLSCLGMWSSLAFME